MKIRFVCFQKDEFDESYVKSYARSRARLYARSYDHKSYDNGITFILYLSAGMNY